jgi:hypothetical protein
MGSKAFAFKLVSATVFGVFVSCNGCSSFYLPYLSMSLTSIEDLIIASYYYPAIN